MKLLDKIRSYLYTPVELLPSFFICTKGAQAFVCVEYSLAKMAVVTPSEGLVPMLIGIDKLIGETSLANL